ncbi:Mov34/MPN/PAD-1 family protein [Demequina sp.]|uniref:Mov34/MPN/PAD-1 family protein n=1 Tax=Demequina sp. TaxID=2050685 RepID=UPI003D10F2CD
MTAVIVYGSAWANIMDFAAASDPSLETGGALFGEATGGRAVVVAASDAGPGATHLSDFFLRDLAYTQAFASRLHADTGAQWVGEWHTHPEGSGTLSERDLATYVGHLTDRSLSLDTFVSIVLTPSAHHVSLEPRLWLLTRMHDLVRVTSHELTIGEPSDDREV